jgi:homopolymeric O-antigen transport system permease protein
MITESAVELYKYRDLMRNLVWRDLAVRYRRSVLGFSWSMLNPIINTVVYAVVFSTIFRFSIKDYIIYFLSGYIIWNFFSQTTSVATKCIVANSSLFNKVYMPKATFVLSVAVSGLVHFCCALLTLLVFMLLLGKSFQPAILFAPVALLFVMMFTIGVSLIVASVTVFFHDIGEMYQALLVPWMFLTPVIYPKEIVPQQYLSFLKLNPWYYLLECFRAPLYRGTLPDGGVIFCAGIVALLALVAGYLVFTKLEDKFIYYA